MAWGPHLKPRVGGRPDKRPAAWAHRQKAPGWARTPKTPAGCPHLKPQSSGGCATGSVAGCPLAQTQSRRSAANPGPKPRSATQPNQWPGCLQATTPKSTGTEKLLPSPCTQNSTGPTGSLGQRQNTKQRGAAGLGETAFPGKTRPSRGLNYPRAAPRAPSI